MGITLKEIPFKEFFESLSDVEDGIYMGTDAFVTDDTPLNEILTWEGSRLFQCKVEGIHHEKWVLIRPIKPELGGEGWTHWHLFEWISGYKEAITAIVLVLRGYRTLGRYTGIDRGDGFDDRKGFDELITVLTAVKESYALYDNTYWEIP